MQPMAVYMQHRELTEKIIGCAFRVYNRMGFGFSETVYERCMLIELRREGLAVKSQEPITVFYEGEIVGEFVADLLVDDRVIVELKSIRQLAVAHEIQLVKYLTATGKPVGLLLNFGEGGVEVKRRVRTLRDHQEPAPDPSDPVYPVKTPAPSGKPDAQPR